MLVKMPYCGLFCAPYKDIFIHCAVFVKLAGFPPNFLDLCKFFLKKVGKNRLIFGKNEKIFKFF